MRKFQTPESPPSVAETDAPAARGDNLLADYPANGSARSDATA